MAQITINLAQGTPPYSVSITNLASGAPVTNCQGCEKTLTNPRTVIFDSSSDNNGKNTYKVQVTDNNGCNTFNTHDFTDIDCKKINVTAGCSPTPNLAKLVFSVSGHYGTATYTIQVKTSNGVSVGNPITVPTEGLINHQVVVDGGQTYRVELFKNNNIVSAATSNNIITEACPCDISFTITNPAC